MSSRFIGLPLTWAWRHARLSLPHNHWLHEKTASTLWPLVSPSREKRTWWGEGEREWSGFIACACTDKVRAARGLVNTLCVCFLLLVLLVLLVLVLLLLLLLL